MARQSASATKSKAKARPSSPAKHKGRAASPSEKATKNGKGARPEVGDRRLLDERTRRDIAGVAFAGSSHASSGNVFLCVWPWVSS